MKLDEKKQKKGISTMTVQFAIRETALDESAVNSSTKMELYTHGWLTVEDYE